MTWTLPSLLLGAAFAGVWIETQSVFFRNLFGAPLHLLPGLMVVASLRSGERVMLAMAVLGGLWFDSFSANPLGATILPLLTVGVVLKSFEGLLLRDLPYAQFLLGAGAGILVPLLTLMILLSLGHNPGIGWATLWHLGVSAATGGSITPLLFRVFARIERALNYPAMADSSFRQDREIKRGRL